MESSELDLQEWLGVMGSGVIAAVMIALAMPWPAHEPRPAAAVEAMGEAQDDAARP